MLDGATGWTLLAGLILATGAIATRWLILPWIDLDGNEARAGLPSRVATIGLVGATVVVVGMSLSFLRQILEFRDPSSPWREEASVLLSTSWGDVWMLGVGASVLLVVAFAAARCSDTGWWITTPVGLALAAFPALTGHAAAAEPRVVFVLADTLHVLAAGAWIGGLVTIVSLEFEAIRSAQASRLPALVPAFSRVAMASVATLVLTGALATWEHLPMPGALFTTAWGKLLVAKLIVTGLVLTIGARNFRVLTPRLGSPAGNTAMRRSALVELAFAQIVLLLTAILVRTSPMGG